MEENKNVEVLEETKANTPKKKSPVGLIILVIILMVGCLVGGYFINESGILGSKKDEKEEKNKDKEKEKKEENQKKAVEIDVNSATVVDLFNKITTANRNYCGFYKLFTDKKMTGNDLDNYDKSLVMLASLYKKGSNEGTTYTKQDIEDMYKKIFGKDVKFEHGDIKGCPLLTYDSSKEVYTVGPAACGGTCGPHTHGKVISAVEDNYEIEMTVAVAFYDNETWYSDYAKTQKIDNVNVTYENGELVSNIDYSKVATYKVVFKLEDGNYVFVSSEPVK